MIGEEKAFLSISQGIVRGIGGKIGNRENRMRGEGHIRVMSRLSLSRESIRGIHPE